MSETYGKLFTPESSESSEDTSLQREQAQQSGDVVTPDREIGQLSGTHLAMSLREVNLIDPAKKKESQDRPKRATGIHPTIRTTSTDGKVIMPPVPSQDDHNEDIPGEGDNPYHDISDDDYDVSEDV